MIAVTAALLPLVSGSVPSPLPVSPAAAATGDITSIDLTEVGSNVLASLGLDGQTKRRGQNTDVATLGNTAFVGGGSLFTGVRSNAGRICTDYGGIKVVDVSNPAAPVVTNTITVADVGNVNQGPTGNPRRGQNVPNVSASVSALHAIRHPVLNKDILAIATQRCEQTFSNARLEFWDVTNRLSPSLLATYTGGGPASYEDVNMFTRNNGPGGAAQVYAMATSPFQGHFRVIDITSLSLATQPTLVGHFPSNPVGTAQSLGDNTYNGCRIFSATRNAKPTPDKTGVIMSAYDGTQPATSAIHPTALSNTNVAGGANPNSAALVKLDLDAMPVVDNLPVTSTEVLRSATPNPKSWGYPSATDGGMTAAGIIEGNASDVEPFTGPGGELLSFVSEEDMDPALTNVSITSPAGIYPDTRGCQMVVGARLFSQPGQQISGQVANVGRGCPASGLANDTLPVEDPYLEDPAGKIALFESGGSLFNGCSTTDKVARLAAAGATAVVGSLGCCPSNNLFIGTGEKGIPTIPVVGVEFKQFNKMAGYMPGARVLSGSTYPASWDRTTTSNVTVRQRALAITAASNATPIQITTGTTAHLLNVGDRVSLYQVPGNTAANGNWLVKAVPTSTTFTIWDGVNDAVGNGASQAGGVVVFCPPGSASCAAQRSDFPRFKSVSNATDLAARGSVNPMVVTVAAPGANMAPPRNAGRNYRVVTVPVEPLAGPLNAGAIVRFDNDVQVPLATGAITGATTISASFPGDGDSVNGNLPTGTKGSVAAGVVAGVSYKAGVDLEVESRVDGTFRAAVVWYTAAGTVISEDEIGNRTAVSPRSRSEVTVTAPAGAVRATTKFEWTGAATGGTAYADTFAFVPAGLALNLKDLPGACNNLTAWPPTTGQCGTAAPRWGAQKIVDFSGANPTQIGTYESPNSKVWPPPDNGIYMPTQARMFGKDVAFTTWMSDGLRVLDVSDPTSPVEKAAIVPAGMTDPTPTAGAGPTNRRDGSAIVRGPSWPDNRPLIAAVDIIPTGQGTGYAVLSDINAGLRVVKFAIHRSGTEGLFHPVSPSRILDTRSAAESGGTAPIGVCNPSPCARVAAGAPLELQVTGQGGIPAGGVSSVVMNVAVTGPSAGGFLRVWPSDQAEPNASNLNYVAGQTVPNQVTVKLSATGTVKISHNQSGDTHVIADVAGWYSDDTGVTGTRFTALTPARVLDTRSALESGQSTPIGTCTPSPCARVAAGTPVEVQVSGQGGVPSTGVTAVVMNVAVTGPSADGFMRVWPGDQTEPNASNLNYVAGETVPNLVTVKLSATGTVKISHNTSGDTHVIADVAGWYSDEAATTGARFTALSPTRALDTRSAAESGQSTPIGTCTPSPCARVAAGTPVQVQLSGQAGVPATGATAVVMNVAVTGPSAGGFLRVWPANVAEPNASNLNYVAGETVPNLVAVKLSTGGAVKISHNQLGNTHVIADVAGWFNSE